MIDLRKDFEPEEVLAATVRFMMDIMASGKSEASRVAAGRLLTDLARRHGADGKRRAPHGPVLYFVPSGRAPPLGEGEYDTSVVDEDSESDEPDFIVKDCE